MTRLPIERDESTYEFIRRYIAENGFAPSFREIMEGVGVSSTSMVTYRLTRLSAAGKLAWTPGKARSIRLIKKGTAK